MFFKVKVEDILLDILTLDMGITLGNDRKSCNVG
jgi:hypothetical protein